jgi:hypothetical protein
VSFAAITFCVASQQVFVVVVVVVVVLFRYQFSPETLGPSYLITDLSFHINRQTDGRTCQRKQTLRSVTKL